MSHSKNELLVSMQDHPSTSDWGAISIFGRTRLNRLLEQQFVAGFDELSFLPPFNMSHILLTENGDEWMDLEAVILSQPLLSFETASLDNSQATLTLWFIAGTVTSFSAFPGRPAMMTSSFKLSEQQGFNLIMTVNLTMAVGEVDKRGRVTLDLKDGSEFTTNLANQLNVQHRIGQAFESLIQVLPRHKRVFELGMLDLKGYNPLTPTTFRILTQAAPGAKDAKSANYGEGGVVIFIALRGKPSPGYLPGEGSGFPYFIPDDKDAEGRDLYSAALVLSYDMVQYVEQQRLDLLNSLLFPGQNIFVESSRHNPHDMIVFGNIDPTLTTVTLEPLFKVIQAADTQKFDLIQAGKRLNHADVTWSVHSINTTHSAGSISALGLYRSVAPQNLGKETVRNIVTASYYDMVADRTIQASALIAVVFDGMTVAPQSSVSYAEINARPVAFSASTLGGGTLEWSLPGGRYGSLVGTGNTAIYTPPSTLPGSEVMAVQQIKVQDLTTGSATMASVVLLAAIPTLDVHPPYSSGMSRSAQVQLSVSPYDPEHIRWSIASGGGTVTQDGLFSAPAQIDSPVSVVRCELIIDGSVYAEGYSVVQLSDFSAEKSWLRLANFKLTAPADQRSAFANGYQQIAVDVEIETEPVNGQDYPVTPEEMSSLTIVYRNSGQELDYLATGQDGIEDDDFYTWVVNSEENRFNRYAPFLKTVDEPVHEVQNRVTRRRVYVQTKAKNPETFFAKFVDEYAVPHASNENSQQAPYTIELSPVTPQKFPATNYQFSPRRVAGGGNNPPQQEDYDYFLTTTDYWLLEFVGTDGKSVRFVRCEFEGNQSTIQWESRRCHETMFSYTGYLFNDMSIDGEQGIIKYDDQLDDVMSGKVLDGDIVSGQNVGEGQLMISLFRTDDVKYFQTTPSRLITPRCQLKLVWYGDDDLHPNESNSGEINISDVFSLDECVERKWMIGLFNMEDAQPVQRADARLLETPLKIRMLDMNGNQHALSIGFPSMDIADSRNTLLLNVI
ncbi:Uncharacterized protein ALO68_03718 [Pseudomonas syringae pv. helianthi]|uniref:Uncharacterized protein n=1 Tax=Pseudomonas syringae pv. helianthi TaxID=251654 RepID=A0A0P9RBF4_9PSED|nr:hypothetical protein [Pseudomonas syringae group genomosp. 7]KPX39876.1 Uncharacterized protein ALO68_03718 [Pseudomonas syringae pv. helianthi]UNB61237.1 hypothetical protein MME54_16350 [Pseudomonas syringae pv. helianthi]